MVHTDVNVIINASLGGARYFLTFFDDASEYPEAFHLKVRKEAAKLHERYFRWLEHQPECSARKIPHNCGIEYLKGSKFLEADGIDISLTCWLHSWRELWAKQLNSTIKDASLDSFQHAGAPASLCVECLYVLFDAIYQNVRGRTKTPEQVLTDANPSAAYLLTLSI